MAKFTNQGIKGIEIDYISNHNEITVVHYSSSNPNIILRIETYKRME